MKFKGLFKSINDKNKRLFKNTILLYFMTFSAQLFNLATMPYLSRVLGPTVYGKVGLAISYMAYVQIIVDFGFILSATRKVADNRDDTRALSRIVSAVAILKFLLGIIVSVVFIIVVFQSDMNEDAFFYIFYLMSQLIYGMLPDFLYRGLEDMKIITYRTILIKLCYMILVFVFVKNENDYYMIPLFNLIGNAAAIISMYIDAYKRYNIRICKVSAIEVIFHLKDSAQFFASRAAATVYQASNAIFLSAIYGSGSPTIGYYSSAEKVVSLAKTASSPVADSLYPYMIKNKNYRLVKKIIFLVMPIVTICVAVCAIFPCQICSFIFGEEYYQSGYMLRLLLPYILVVFPNYLLAFPIMVPMGMARLANISNVVGLFIQITLLVSFFLTSNINVYTICISTSITEVSVFIFRLLCVLIKSHRSKAENA